MEKVSIVLSTYFIPMHSSPLILPPSFSLSGIIAHCLYKGSSPHTHSTYLTYINTLHAQVP